MRVLPVALLLLLALAVPGVSSASAAPLGVPVRFQPGDTLAWVPGPGEQHAVFVRAGEEPVQVTWRTPPRTPEQAPPTSYAGGAAWEDDRRQVEPRASFGERVRLKEGESLSFSFSGGGGWALLSSWSMADAGRGDGRVATLLHAGELAPGACAAQSFSAGDLAGVRLGAGVPQGPVLVKADGAGVRFQLLDAAMDVLAAGTGSLSASLSDEDVDVFRSSAFHLQACAPDDAAAASGYAFDVTRRAAERQVPLPAALLAGALGLAALVARRR